MRACVRLCGRVRRSAGFRPLLQNSYRTKLHAIYGRHKQHTMVTHDELLSTLDAATCIENRNVAGDSKINLHEAISKQNLHQAIPKQNLLGAVRLSCYRVIAPSCSISKSKPSRSHSQTKPFVKQFPINAFLKQSGYCVNVSSCYRLIMERFPSKTLMKQSGYRAIVL